MRIFARIDRLNMREMLHRLHMQPCWETREGRARFYLLYLQKPALYGNASTQPLLPICSAQQNARGPRAFYLSLPLVVRGLDTSSAGTSAARYTSGLSYTAFHLARIPPAALPHCKGGRQRGDVPSDAQATVRFCNRCPQSTRKLHRPCLTWPFQRSRGSRVPMGTPSRADDAMGWLPRAPPAAAKQSGRCRGRAHRVDGLDGAPRLLGCAPVTLGGSGGDGATGGTMRRCRGLVGGHVSVPGATGRLTPLVSIFGGGGVGAPPPPLLN